MPESAYSFQFLQECLKRLAVVSSISGSYHLLRKLLVHLIQDTLESRETTTERPRLEDEFNLGYAKAT